MASGSDESLNYSKKAGDCFSDKDGNDVYNPFIRTKEDGSKETSINDVRDSPSKKEDEDTEELEMEFLESCKDELRIVLIGKTGVGKSATGNTILNKSAFESKGSTKSLTTISQSQEKQWGNKTVVVIDTPGLFDTNRTMSQVKEQLTRCIGMTLPGPHAFLYVISASSRQTTEEDNAFLEFIKTFGKQVYEFLIIIFVRKDEMGDLTFEKFLKEELTASLKIIVEKVGEKRCFWLNNRMRSSKAEQETVECILQTVNELNRHSPVTYYRTTVLKKALCPLLKKMVELGYTVSPRELRDTFKELGKLYATLFIELYKGAKRLILGEKCNIL